MDLVRNHLLTKFAQGRIVASEARNSWNNMVGLDFTNRHLKVEVDDKQLDEGQKIVEAGCWLTDFCNQNMRKTSARATDQKNK
jgi:hypothetical protein